MRQMVRQRRLLAAEAAAAVLISLLVLSADDLASNGGSLSAPTMAPEVFFAKDSSYGSELHGRNSCEDPGAAHAEFACSFLMTKGIKEDRLNPYNNQTEYCKALCKGSKDDGGSATVVDENPYFCSEDDCKTHDMVFPKTSLLVHDVCVDSILDIAEGYEESHTEDSAVDIYADLYWKLLKAYASNSSAKDNATGPTTTIQVTGLSIDVFDASYNELVGNVSLGIVDGAAGDVTLTASRIGYVDFAMSYTQTGASLLVLSESDLEPIQWTFLTPLTKELWFVIVGFFFTGFVVWVIERPRFSNALYFAFSTLTCSHAADDDSKPSILWIFFKPLTKELWLATVCFVFFTGFVFCMIERSINPVFQGSSLAQFSTALYFVLSTLTFSHGQILISPLSKTVLVVWCLAVLVLVQSYLANLSSMLAAEASTFNGSSTAGPVPITLRSFSGLFAVTGCILALMLLINFTRWIYAAYTTVRASESQSTPQNDLENGSVVVPGHVSSAISGDEEAGGVIQDSMSNAAEPAPDVYVQAVQQIEMTSTSNGVGGAL